MNKMLTKHMLGAKFFINTSSFELNCEKSSCKVPNTTIAEFANTVDPDETAHYDRVCPLVLIQFILKVFRNITDCFLGALRV